VAIDLDRVFEVESGVEDTWSFFTDPVEMFPCIPSAKVRKRLDERTFEGELGYRLGPFGATFRGEMEYDELEREERLVRLTGEAEDTRRDARAHLVLESRLTSLDGAGTRVAARQLVDLSGSLAHLAESAMARNMADMLFGRFVGCVQKKLAG
jgi:carbon monoxide dehydrogenase subunit G